MDLVLLTSHGEEACASTSEQLWKPEKNGLPGYWIAGSLLEPADHESRSVLEGPPVSPGIRRKNNLEGPGEKRKNNSWVEHPILKSRKYWRIFIFSIRKGTKQQDQE